MLHRVSVFGPCLYIKAADGYCALVLVYVDDVWVINIAIKNYYIDLHAFMGHALLEVLPKMVENDMVKDVKAPSKLNESSTCRGC